jgi:hypothetical protein
VATVTKVYPKVWFIRAHYSLNPQNKKIFGFIVLEYHDKKFANSYQLLLSISINKNKRPRWGGWCFFDLINDIHHNESICLS